MRSFASDNNSGVHPLVMEALNRANSDHAVGYGADTWTSVPALLIPLLAQRLLISMSIRAARLPV